MADDELDERLSKRFAVDQEDESDDGESAASDDVDDTAMSSTPSQKEENAQNAQNERNDQSSQKAGNVKEDWNVRSFYLDDDLDSELRRAFKRLDLELDEAGASLQKTRHFYPLVVELGLERLEGMERTELIERKEKWDAPE